MCAVNYVCPWGQAGPWCPGQGGQQDRTNRHVYGAREGGGGGGAGADTCTGQGKVEGREAMERR